VKKEHEIELEDGKVSTVNYKSDSDKWFFVCHGFGGHKERQDYVIEAAKDAGFNAVGFDFRGNGDSSGEFIDQNLSTRIKDLKAVMGHFDPEEYYVYGTSFGAKVALHAAEELDPDGLILKAPVTYNSVMEGFRSAVEEKGEFSFIEGKPIDKRFFEDLDKYRFEDAAPAIDMPVIIFHGDSDTTVHIENTLEAIKHLETDVTLTKFEGVKHSFTDDAKSKMKKSIFDWIERL
jgi:alpha-beta hydrolase superfamily lysophospholipase